MRRFPTRIGLLCLGAMVAAGALSAQQTSGTFRWIDFHAPADQNIVAWVTRSLAVSKWTAIREIGVEYDAALVETVDRANPQSAPGEGTFTVWSVSLTSHAVTPLVTGVNVRWFDPVRFADGAPEEWPILYDDCLDCQPNTYFTAFHYDAVAHAWSARWMTGGHGAPVWNTNHPSGVGWTQAFALLSSAGHMAMYAWNHFDYPKPRPAEDYITRYDLDPFSHLDRRVVMTNPTPPSRAVEQQMAEMELEICRAETAPAGLARGQDSPVCASLLKRNAPRQPVTTPPANNRGQMGWTDGRGGKK